MRRSSAVAIMVLMGFTVGAWSAEPTPTVKTCCEPRSLLSGCLDDYCPKPYPPTHTVPCNRADDYCRKPYPRIWTLCDRPCGPDEYRRKPCPELCRPLNAEHYICGSVRCAAPGTGAIRLAQPVAQAVVVDKKTRQVR